MAESEKELYKLWFPSLIKKMELFIDFNKIVLVYPMEKNQEIKFDQKVKSPL